MRPNGDIGIAFTDGQWASLRSWQDTLPDGLAVVLMADHECADEVVEVQADAGARTLVMIIREAAGGFTTICCASGDAYSSVTLGDAMALAEDMLDAWVEEGDTPDYWDI